MYIRILKVEVPANFMNDLKVLLNAMSATAKEETCGEYGDDAILLCSRCLKKKAKHDHLTRRDAHSNGEPFTQSESCCGDCCEKIP